MSGKNFNEKNVEFEPICCVDCREMIATPSHLSSRMLIKVTQPFVWLCCQTWCLMSITIINKTLHFIPVFSLAVFCIQWFTVERRREEIGHAHSSMMPLVKKKTSKLTFIHLGSCNSHQFCKWNSLMVTPEICSPAFIPWETKALVITQANYCYVPLLFIYSMFNFF